MQEIVRFLVEANIMDLATDPRALFFALALFVVAVLMRWKSVLIVLLGLGGILTVAHYSRLQASGNQLDTHLLIFALGTILVAGVLIYFLFIRGD